MDKKIDKLKQIIKDKVADERFLHHDWYIKWHLQIVEDICNQVLPLYPEADPELTIAMAWIHDYGKIVAWVENEGKVLANRNQQYQDNYRSEARDLLIELGFETDFANQAMENIKVLDAKVDLDKANIETQIVSSADGCSHFVGLFYKMFWREFPNMPLDKITEDSVRKVDQDWSKVCLPELKETYQIAYEMTKLQLTNKPLNLKQS